MGYRVEHREGRGSTINMLVSRVLFFIFGKERFSIKKNVLSLYIVHLLYSCMHEKGPILYGDFGHFEFE